MTATVTRPRQRLQILAWLAGTALFIGVAVAALSGLADRLGTLSGQLDQRQTLAGIVAVTLYLLVAVCWLIGIAFVARRLGTRWALGLGLIGAAGVRIAASLAIDVPLAGDWLAFHDQAVSVATTGPGFGDRPIGYPLLLGGLYAAFGAQIWLAEALNVAISLVSAAFVFDLLRRSAGPTAAAVGIGLLAIMPSLVLMTPVVSADPTYTALLLTTIWVLAVVARAPLRVRGRGMSPSAWGTFSAGLAGVLLGASQYVLPSSLVLLPAFVIVALVATREARPQRAAVALALAFFAVLAPVIADNAARYGELSVETSSYAGWDLYVGTNPENDGGPSEADAERLATMPGDSLRKRSDAAGQLGLQRIGDDPGAFAGLAARKAVGMWSDDGYAVFTALESERDPPVAAGLLVAGYLASALAWTLVTALAAWGVLRGGPVLPVWLLAAMLVAGSLTLLHAVIEVQPRYHAYLTPLWLAAAALTLTRRSGSMPTAAEARPPAPR